MKPLRLEVPEEFRAELRRRCETTPASPGFSNAELVDLTFHAVSEAVAAIERISARAPYPMAQMMVMSLTISSAVGLLSSTQQSLIEQIKRSIVKNMEAAQ